MKQFLEKIWNFAKQYPLIFGMLCLSIFWSLKEYIEFVYYVRFTWGSLLFLTPVIFFSLTILLLKKLLNNENDRTQKCFLLIVCIFILGVQGNIFDNLSGSLGNFNEYQCHYINQFF